MASVARGRGPRAHTTACATERSSQPIRSTRSLWTSRDSAVRRRGDTCFRRGEAEVVDAHAIGLPQASKATARKSAGAGATGSPWVRPWLLRCDAEVCERSCSRRISQTASIPLRCESDGATLVRLPVVQFDTLEVVVRDARNRRGAVVVGVMELAPACAGVECRGLTGDLPARGLRTQDASSEGPCREMRRAESPPGAAPGAIPASGV